MSIFKIHINSYCKSNRYFAMRKLGTVISIAGKSFSESRDLVRKGIATHGMITIPDLDLNPKQMVEITRQIVGQPILMPPEMSFGNLDSEYNYVCRVGNVRADGSLIQSQSAFKNASYWHQDGSFWEQQAKLVVNLLHSKITPQEGGETLIFDLVQANEVLKKFYPQLYTKMQTYQAYEDMTKIQDFTNVQNLQIDAKLKSKHPMIKKNFMNGKTCINLGYNLLITPQGKQIKDQEFKKHELHPVNIMNKLLEKMPYYTHQWKVGDLCMWDNTQVLHRSKGPWKGKRLLLRTQGDLKKPTKK